MKMEMNTFSVFLNLIFYDLLRLLKNRMALNFVKNKGGYFFRSEILLNYLVANVLLLAQAIKLTFLSFTILRIKLACLTLVK
jgi:hypothetical protein